MFTTVIVTQVVVLMLARRELVATGDVTITVNDDPDKALTTTAGGNLLGTLAAKKLFIPSACGGKGSCGVCTVTVLEGGGAMLPTETSHINRREAREGVRLSCQVKVKQDMKIELPPEVFNIREWTCKVLSSTRTSTWTRNIARTGTNTTCGATSRRQSPAKTSCVPIRWRTIPKRRASSC
jgi:Na+-transporting NADH:ubiquinone oxidoreductase subunit F